VNPFQIILIFAIRLYRWTISPAQTFLIGATAGCRFTPTCSQYAVEAIRERGAFVGGALAAKRICRCNPWGKCGHDPVPKTESGFRRDAQNCTRDACAPQISI
jgi:putative membrane protein insertion efficiency factor